MGSKPKTAIIMQGGAMRASFGGGVLYELQKKGIFTDIIASSSAGVPTAAYYAAHQCEEMRKIWTEDLGNKRFIRYDNLLLGKPIYDIEYLVNDIFRMKRLLSIEALMRLQTTLVFPLYNYVSRQLILKTSADADFSQRVWDYLHLSMIVHDRHILWGTAFESYVDGALDPFALYKTPFLPENTRVLVIWNESKFDMHAVKFFGQKIFLLLQGRGFPEEVKRMLRIRGDLIRDGFKMYNEFCMRYRPIVIKPDRLSILESLDVISRNKNHLERLFEEGRDKARIAFDAGLLKDFI